MDAPSEAMSAVALSHLRKLPSVDDMLRSARGREAVERFGRSATAAAIRARLDAARQSLRGTRDASISSEDLSLNGLGDAVLAQLEEDSTARVTAVYNLTGTVLHTNLGRALLAEAAITAATQAMRHAVALEYDLETGRRGERDDLVRNLLIQLTGAEDATLVNNNAAALMLVLNTLAEGREAIVSRGELIEIGGAFRLPELMARSGVRLREVGSTNRTHLRDYNEAVAPQTGLLLKVHTSNYRVEGFTAEVDARTLGELAGERCLPLVNDLGSGTLVDLAQWGLAHEPTVAEAVNEGAHLVTFSGDKLLGGPQAGFIVGRADLIARINRNPMKRAMRVDKIRLAAVEATLRLYREPERLAQSLPTLRSLARPVVEISDAADRIVGGVAQAVGSAFSATVAPCASQIGSGALPLATLPSTAIRVVRTDRRGSALNALAAAFRALPMPVIGRIEADAFWLDCRCLEDEAGFQANLAHLAPVDA